MAQKRNTIKLEKERFTFYVPKGRKAQIEKMAYDSGFNGTSFMNYLINNYEKELEIQKIYKDSQKKEEL
ncbi:hypothetical protein P5E99_15785 [Clostridium perfringens]|nr:hypothetical protein [Clostridium perfringens]MDK0675387.1 hypothetical protein [Clostridium perfringens]MDM0464796.1 hypothetical protein [Clostridium perfringens]MDM0710613.1 hypothetical protein [Clostridium perfringens]HBI7095727.1 hypothetical protein [Clostridium perfringens]